MGRKTFSLIAAALALLLGPLAHAQDDGFGHVTKGPGWTYTRLGNQADVKRKTTFGLMFEGGGKDVNDAYRWMCAHAGGGDFLVIRATETADYNPYIQKLCPGLNSVSTLKILSRDGAKQPFVRDTILKAEALFIAGGDQSNYVRFWQGTPVNAAINAPACRGVPIGGTSAGNAVLAQFAFAALDNTITSTEALRNPFDPRVTIDQAISSSQPRGGRHHHRRPLRHPRPDGPHGRLPGAHIARSRDAAALRDRHGREHRIPAGGGRQGYGGRFLHRLLPACAGPATDLQARRAARLRQGVGLPDHQGRDLRRGGLGRNRRDRLLPLGRAG